MWAKSVKHMPKYVPSPRQDAWLVARCILGFLAASRKYKCAIFCFAFLVFSAMFLQVASAHELSSQAALDEAHAEPTDPLVNDGISIADGLPEFDVWSIAQDLLGFTWFGMSSPLFRYH